MTRRIDHLVLPTADLEAAADVWTRMGFTLGARNRHPWGTENRIIQLPGFFVELITLGPDPAAEPGTFGRHVGDWLAADRAGASMIVVDSRDAVDDARWFRQAGIGAGGPFRFARQGRDSEGQSFEVAFTLAFAREPSLPELLFFACQQHAPERFWDPGLQQHANTALRLEALTLVGAGGAAAQRASFFVRFAGAPPGGTADGAVVSRLANGVIEQRSPSQFVASHGDDPLAFRGEPAAIAAMGLAVADRERLLDTLATGGIAHREEGERVVVPSGVAGIVVAFTVARPEEPAALGAEPEPPRP